MPRVHRVERPNDTSFFTPTQLMPRVLVESIMRGWAGWLREHLVAFPRLIGEHHCGVVVMSVAFRHEVPLTFFQTDALSFETQVRFTGNARFAEIDVGCSSDGRKVAHTRAVTRVVLMSDDAAMGAAPGELPADLQARLQPDELTADKPARPFKPRLDQVLAGGTLLAESSHDFMIHRHQCEVADQWSFIEIQAFAADGREKLIADHGDKEPFLRRGFREPIASFQAEFKLPMYFLDQARIHTRAYRFEDRLALVHRIEGSDGQTRAEALEEI